MNPTYNAVLEEGGSFYPSEEEEARIARLQAAFDAVAPELKCPIHGDLPFVMFAAMPDDHIAIKKGLCCGFRADDLDDAIARLIEGFGQE